MKEFVEEIAKRLDIQRKELIEKDIRIHLLLVDLSKDAFFSRNFVFKGGTCLIKCYLGYFRFSEDIDFTWRDQSVFKGKSQKEIRRMISGFKDSLGVTLVDIARNRGFDFHLEGKDRKYVEFGGGNKTITFKLWYDSEILGTRSFIKIQINFVDVLKFAVRKRSVRGLLGKKKEKELSVLFEADYSTYMEDISLLTYDIKEILCEKVRAILTRQGVKARDFVDVFLIEKQFGIHVNEVKSAIVEKTQFILDLYEKYQTNFKEKMTVIASGELFRWGTEKNFLLTNLDEQEFYRFIKRFNTQLHSIGKEME